MNELFGLLAIGPDGWGDELLAGLQITLALALATAPIGLAGGFFLALARRSESVVHRAPATAFTTIFKGLPELITLFIVYYGVSLLLAWFVGLFTDQNVELSAFLAGMIALGAVSASFASEVFMAALSSVPKGQYEAAHALGLSRVQTVRKIILPQLIKVALPGLGNLWLVLLKDTALVSVIALPDLLRRTSIAVGSTKEPFFFYLVAILLYFTISMISMGIFALLERHYAKATVR